MCAEMDSEMPDSFCTAVKLKPTPSAYALEHTLPKIALYVPKRLLTIVVPDDVVTTVVKSIIKVNKTGKAGDGKIFVSPIDGALRVRTGERNGEAIA
jgi:nitrogen regulatory protein PII 2